MMLPALAIVIGAQLLLVSFVAFVWAFLELHGQNRTIRPGRRRRVIRRYSAKETYRHEHM